MSLEPGAGPSTQTSRPVSRAKTSGRQRVPSETPLYPARASDAHVAIVGPVGVGKTFLAHALGHIACRRGAHVLAVRTEQMLKTLKQARLDHSYEIEFRKIISVDLLLLDDFAIDVLDTTESRDLYDILLERYRTGSIVVKRPILEW